MEDTKVLYSEVLGVLLALGNKYVEKTPSKIINYLKENCDLNSIPKINKDLSLQEQNISEDSQLFITILKLNYWCESEEEKQEIYKILIENEEKYKKQLNENSNIFGVKNEALKEIEQNTKEDNNTKDLIAKTNNKWYNKIVNFFKKLFRKNKDI